MMEIIISILFGDSHLFTVFEQDIFTKFVFIGFMMFFIYLQYSHNPVIHYS